MRRTSLQIDDEVLSQAQAVLGTTGLSDTVDTALREAIRRDRRRRLAARLRSGEGIDRSTALLEATRPTR